jgi:hypothetical protein
MLGSLTAESTFRAFLTMSSATGSKVLGNGLSSESLGAVFCLLTDGRCGAITQLPEGFVVLALLFGKG